MSGIMIVKVSILGVLAVVKDLGSKEYQPRRREEKKKAAQEIAATTNFV